MIWMLMLFLFQFWVSRAFKLSDPSHEEGITTSMKDLEFLIHLLKEGKPFGFAHFNDGEIIAVTRERSSVDFGWQRTSPELSIAMKNALTMSPSNFYIGIPCYCKWGFQSLTSLQLLNISLTTEDLTSTFDETTGQWNVTGLIACPVAKPILYYERNMAVKGRITVATVFIDGNYIYAQQQLISIFRKHVLQHHRGLHMIHNSRADTTKLPFPVNFTFPVPTTQAFESHYQELRSPKWLKEFPAGDIMILLVGPLGRILASEWTKLRPDMTFLELGSFYDSLLWGRRYDLATARPCMTTSDYSMI